jgi:hypothetical protein
MEREVFVATDVPPPWWLIAEEIDYALVEPRKDLGVALGYDREARWWLEKTNVEELYNILQRTKPTLLATELDEATDERTRKGWLDQVLAALAPQPEDTEKTGGDEVLPAAKAAAPVGEAPKKRSSAFGAKSKPSLDAVVKKEMAEMSGNVSSLAAEMGISEEEMADLLKELPANFEQMVAEQARSIVASEQ